jgi:hypothetical protein
MDQAVIPECFVDTNLTETLVPPNSQYNHQKGCGTVTKIMQERFADRFALGIIDKDKKEVEYLKHFIEINNAGSLILHKHTTRHHYMIQIAPAMERFILTSAEAVGISLSTYGLPETLDALKKVSKTVNSKNDPKFKGLFKAMKKASAPEMLRLAAWISYLKDKNYNVDIDELKNL